MENDEEMIMPIEGEKTKRRRKKIKKKKKKERKKPNRVGSK